MFTEALFTTAKVWQQHKCPLMKERALYMDLHPSLKSHSWEILQRQFPGPVFQSWGTGDSSFILSPRLSTMCCTLRRDGTKDLGCVHLLLTYCLLTGGRVCVCAALLFTHMSTHRKWRTHRRARLFTSSSHRRILLFDTLVWLWSEISSQKYSTLFWSLERLWGLIEKSKLPPPIGPSAVFAFPVSQSFMPSFPLALGFSA